MEEGCAGAIDGSKHRWRTERRNFEVQMQSHIQYVALVEVIEDRRWFTQIVLKVTKMESAQVLVEAGDVTRSAFGETK
jgi:hypothetical protein